MARFTVLLVFHAQAQEAVFLSSGLEIHVSACTLLNRQCLTLTPRDAPDNTMNSLKSASFVQMRKQILELFTRFRADLPDPKGQVTEIHPNVSPSRHRLPALGRAQPERETETEKGEREVRADPLGRCEGAGRGDWQLY